MVIYCVSGLELHLKHLPLQVFHVQLHLNLNIIQINTKLFLSHILPSYPMPTFIAPLTPPLLLLAAVNLLPLIYPPPVLVQLLLNAILSIHVGTLFSSSLTKASYQ
jgi:hypothetical protein